MKGIAAMVVKYNLLWVHVSIASMRNVQMIMIYVESVQQ